MLYDFGKYRLLQRLAFGGMAEVFLARAQGEAGFSKTVVIKRLHPRLSEDQEFTRMLIDEARITSQLVHTNICQVLDLGQVDGSYFIAMEYVPGEDLRTVQDYYRRQRLHMPSQVAVYIVTELLAGLDYAHRKEDFEGHKLGVIHRDISPQNLLISYEGEVKIIDFGIAKARQRLVQTQAGVIKGKFRYMSPEQAAGGKVDQRTDLFAASVVLYELLRGEPHSLNVPDTEVLRRMRDAEFDPLRRDPKEVPPALVKLLARALHKSPRKRFQTASAFRQELMSLMPELPVVFGDRTSPFGREELAILMKRIFPAERRRKRSGDSSQRAPKAARQALPPRKADHLTGGMMTPPAPLSDVIAKADKEKENEEAAIVAASGRLPRDSTAPLLDNNAEDGAAEQKPDVAPSDGSAQLAQKKPPRPEPPALASPGAPSVHSHVATRVGEPSAEVLARDTEATEDWKVAADAATVAVRRITANGRPREHPHAPAGRAGEVASAPAGRRRGQNGAAGAFSLGASSVPEPRKQVSDRTWETDDVAPALDPCHSSWSGEPAHTSSGDATVAATRIAVPAAGRTGPASGPRRHLLRRLLFAIVLAMLGGAAFYVGRYGLPGWLVLPAGWYGGQDLVVEEEPSGDEGFGGKVARAGDDERARAKSQHKKPEGYGRVKISSQPSGAAVQICGKRLVHPTPVAVRLRRGRRCKLLVQLSGHEPYKARVRVPGGKTMTVRAKLRPESAGGEPPGADSQHGMLVVTSIRRATVYVNGRAMGRTPKLELQMLPGQYTVWLDFTGLGTQTGARMITIKAGQQQRLYFTPTM